MARIISGSAGDMRTVVVTPETTVLDSAARFVVVPLYDGEMGIAPGHSPLIGRLGFGEMRLTSADHLTHAYYVDGGFVQVADNVVTVLTNRAVPAGDLDAEVAAEQLRSARARKAAGDDALAFRERIVDQARAQLRVARRN